MTVKSMLHAVALLTTIVLVPAVQLLSQEWQRFGSMGFERQFHEVAVMDDGRILVAGGTSGSPIADCRIIDPVGRMVIQAASMNQPRSQFSMIAMPDGKVYAAGGYSQLFSENPRTIECYDPSLDIWTDVGTMIEPRGQTSIVAISSDEFMIVGGRIGTTNVRRTCEIFNIATGQSRSAASFPYATSFAKSFVDMDGRILSGTGRTQGPSSFRSNIFHEYAPSTNTWRESVQSIGSLYYPTIITLNDGVIAMVGGSWAESSGTDTFASEVSVLEGQAFRVIGNMQQVRAGLGAVDMGDGRIMAIGGADNDKRSLASCEYTNVRTGEVSQAPTLKHVRAYFTAVAVPSDNGVMVFAIGGTSGATAGQVELLEVGDDRPCDERTVDLVVRPELVRVAGHASLNDESIDLTRIEPFSAGSAWFHQRVNLNGDIDTRFSIRLDQGDDNELPDGSSPGADGWALVFQNAAPVVVGDPGQGIGYSNSVRGLAIEFDTYKNASFVDPNGNHVAIQRSVNQKLTASHFGDGLVAITEDGVPAFSADGSVYHGRILFQQGLLSVWVSEERDLGEPVLSIAVDLRSESGAGEDGLCWIGITSATGFSEQRHQLLSWTLPACGDEPLSVNEKGALAPSLRIAPSPADQQAVVTLPATVVGDWTLRVVSMDGRTLFTSSGVDAQTSPALPAAQFAPGTYAVVVTTNQRSWTTMWSVVR